MLSTLSLMGQKPPVVLPADGDWPTIVGDSIMLIGPKQEALTEEQRYFNPPYLLVYPGKEHLKNDMIRAAICDCNPANPNRRIGVFSVAPDKQVSFSQGNLQYLPAANIWKFADTQYEYLGNANKYLKPTFRNWVDLFGWSANNTTAPFGVSTSTNVADYAGDFVDWGTNTICGDTPNTWRTLSADEWEFLFEKRSNALQLRSKGSIEGHRGHILLPDNWVLPDGVQFVAEPNNLTMDLDINSYTQAEWRIMEKAGAIFLPAAGRRDGTTVGYLVEYSGIWSSTSTTNTNAYHSYYNYESEVIEHHWTSATSRMNGRSVRLVHDTVVPTPEPEYVDLGLSVKWATFNVGATSPEDYGDYFAWGETEPKETYSWATYKWGTSSNLTKYNATDGKTILEPEDDAAQVNWGSKWRMPTKEEQKELIDSCTWEWTTSNNINGYKVTGPNGHSIFLPAGGVRINDVSYAIDEFGYYWSSSSTIDDKSEARSIVFTPTSNSCDSDWLYRGRKIRPVYDDRPPKRIGVFSVAEDKQVSFSQGNLQYTQSTDEWRFAREQYEYIGAANIKDGALADKIDLFGWSANNTTAPFGVSTSTNAADYAGDFVDWGINTISGDAANTWRTLSKEEWEYLIKGRKNASNLRAAAQVNGVNGMILLPDDWECPEGIDFKAGYHTSKGSEYYAEYQQFTKEQWRELETTGAIFLPAAGMHDGNGIADIQAGGYYWSATDNGDTYAYTLISQSSGAYLTYDNRYDVRSVRLVHDTIVPTPEPEYVDLGLSVKWATFNMGATSPEDYGDYFAWGETEPKEEYSWATYKWCQGTANTLTKYCSNGQYGNADYKTILDPEDDAAMVHWGSDWRMPTIDEWLELKQKCSWKKIIINGITGYQVTAKNGNSIFLPRAGLRMSDILYANDSVGYYASSSHLPEFSHEDYASYMLMYDNSISKSSTIRYYGLSIRPVYDDRVTLTVIPTPEDATVGFYYSGGFDVDSNSVKVKKGSSPLYQVAATKKGYLSQGDTLHHITQDTTLYIALRPFSKGTWVQVDTSEFTRVDSFFVSRHQGVFSGPYSSWSYFYAPVLPGETYRVRAHAGQHAALWYAASNAPDQAAGIRPTKVACSANGGIARYIAEEFTIPEGANYLIINTASKGTNLIIERKVPDPCLVVKVNDTLSINLMCVEGGTFRMGVGADNYIERDDPQANKDSTTHLVTLSDYYMAETAVTQGLWQAVMGTDIHDMVAQSPYPDDTPKVGDRYPMGYVFLKDALAFVDELNKRTGLHFRLPTEAEREYAARGGKRSREYKYPGSNDYTQVASPYGTPVAQKLPNELGIYDLSGCTREMCTDSWRTTYIYDEHVVNPVGPIQNAGNRTMRGGHIHSQSRPFTRYPFTTTWCRNELGFRIILPTETQRRMIHVNGSFFEMCFVKGGTFMMGSDAPDAEADEKPVHAVTLSDYYIGQTEVTQHLWQAVMGSGNNPSATKGNNLPVTNITWDEAQTFVERLSELTGLRFRLPTEAEWEYSARGGQNSKGYTYAGSNDIDEVGWFPGNCTQPQAIGKKMPNELGIYDMTGNVYEFCYDWYGPYSAEAQTNPLGPSSASNGYRIVRGGCWQVQTHGKPDSHYCRIANRGHDINGNERIGLRIVLEPEKHYRYGYTQANWDAATSSWGHGGRGHAPADQSCIQVEIKK